MDFRVPPGCTGLSFSDGTRYEARGGRVVVDNPTHARQVRKADPGDRISAATYTPTAAPSRDCVCGFIAFRWQRRCPRCHRPLEGV